MKKLRALMMNQTLGTPSDCWYDFYDDFPLIEASITSQYGIRLRKEYDDISWAEVKNLIRGLGAETPLGNIVSIRSETDKDILKKFTPAQHKIRNEWRQKVANKKLEDSSKLDKEMDFLYKSLEKMFS